MFRKKRKLVFVIVLEFCKIKTLKVVFFFKRLITKEIQSSHGPDRVGASLLLNC